MNYDILNSLVSQGLSSRKIAKQLNCSQTNVRHWLKKLSLKTEHNQYQKKDSDNETERLCSKCKVILPINQFYGRHTYCKECSNKYTVTRLRNYKIQAVKHKGGKCQICGYNKFFGALEFHHLDPSKKDFNLAQSNRRFEAVKAELDKCILLCSNCHRETHAGLTTI